MRTKKLLKNPNPSWSGTARTPFHSLTYAKSGEAVNELGVPVCKFDIDGLPANTVRANAEFVIKACNEHDALCAVADAAQVIFKEMGSRIGPAAFDEFSEPAKEKISQTLKWLAKFRANETGSE